MVCSNVKYVVLPLKEILEYQGQKKFSSTVREKKGTAYNPITNGLKIRSCLLYINFGFFFFSVRLINLIIFSGITSRNDI